MIWSEAMLPTSAASTANRAFPISSQISTLEEEVRDSNDQFKLLIAQYRENASVLCARMEQQLQTLESLVGQERKRLEEAYRGVLLYLDPNLVWDLNMEKLLSHQLKYLSKESKQLKHL